MDDEKALIFETFIVADDKFRKHGREKKEKTEEEKKALEEEKREEFVANPTNQIVMAALGVNNELPIKKKKNEREVSYAVDKELEALVILVKGSKGE